MQQDAHSNARSFVGEAASVAVIAEQLAARLQQPFTGINELQNRARAMAVQHLHDAARNLQQFADVAFTAEDEERWRRALEADADDDAEL